MKLRLKERLRRFVAGSLRLSSLALALGATSAAWGAFTKENPVTGETENYTWKFVGTDTWDGTGNWQDSSSANPSGTPAKSSDNTWDPILFDGNTININANISIEGWNLRMGLYNGANVTMNTFVKYQGDTTMWMTVDKSSQLTIGGFGGGNITDGQAIKLSVAKANGITWNVNLTSDNANNTFEYYLKGEGSVSYQAVSAANHKIKMADVTLTGTSQVSHKTLVSFTSSSQTFTADAAIKVLDSNGDQVATKALTAVNTTASLTASDAVGTCELVQTSTGIDLYWVDGDPANLPAPTVYKPSININFTNGANNGLTTSADVGLTGYAVPGTSWNNYEVANSTFSTVNAIDSTGVASAMSGVSVTISGTRGSYNCSSLTPASNPLHGYIDENANNSTPTVTVTGIPYYKYRVLVYHSTDSESVSFGYDTINGTNYTYVNDALAEGTTAWGNSGAQDSANAIAEGSAEAGNVLVTGELSGSTLTVVGHRAGGNSSARGCIAAIQIIEVKPETTENDLIIDVSGDTTYTVSEAKTLSGTVYLTGNGTLTLDGSAKISAATINVGDLVTLNINADRLDANTFTGAGTVVYDGSQPVLGKGWTDSDNWTGTVWVKNIGSAPAGETSTTAVTLGSDTTTAADNTINSWGNANSYVKFTNVRGHVAAANCPWTLVLEDGADTYAWYNNNGWTGRDITIAALEGDGTFYDQGNNGCRQNLTFTEASNFAGSFNIAGKRVGLGGKNNADNNQTYRGTIEVASGKTVTVATGKTWTTGMGFRVYGTINANGTLAADSSATACAVGTGTVVFGGVPSPAGDKWWKNVAWDGTVEIKGATALNGDYAFNDYGNSDSTLKLTNCSGWLKTNYTCVPALEIGGTFSWNDGGSGLDKTFKVGTLKGSGTISIPSGGAATAVWQITDDWSGFTGPVIGNNTAAARVMVFGSTLPTTIKAGEIHVSEGATLNLDNSSSAWWGVGMGFVVNGTVKASSRSKWGGGTYMKLGDTGVLELTSTSNDRTDVDNNNDYSNVTGTGTIKYSSTSGWRTFPSNDSYMPAKTLTMQMELADSLIITKNDNGETVIGSLAGSKNIRSDWSATSGGSNDRTLTVTQSKDTEWQGKFVSNRITQFNVVAPTEGTPGTLTLSGTQDATIPMQVNGSVNLTGTWKGATTVAGTFGGTGTLTGDLTFSNGATFKAFATDADGLAVSGTVTYPAEGTVTVDVSDLTLTADVALLTASDLNKDKFTLTGAPEKATLEVVNNVLTLKLPVTITVPAVANTTVTVTVNGVAAEPDEEGGNAYTVPVGAEVVVTYVGAEGYKVNNGSYVVNITAAENTTVETASMAVNEYVAWIYDEYGDLVGNPYTTQLSAILAFSNGTGNSVRFKTALDEGHHNALIAGCSYDASTITYTRLPTVATITVGANEYKYTSIAGAVEDAAPGSTIVLVADVALTSMIDIDKAVTLDLNGNTVSVGEWADTEDALFCVLYGGSLTIDDSTGGTVGNPTGDGAIDATGNAAKVYAAIKMTKKGNVRNGDEVATLVVEAGTITGSYYAITGNGSRPGTVITINGGAISGTYPGDNLGIYHPQTGTLTLNGGTITGVTGIEMRAGSLVVPANSQVVVTATGTFSEKADGSGSTVKGAAIALSQHNANPELSATIAGGSFNASGTDGKALYEVDLQNEVTDGIAASVTGGVFSGEVASENVGHFVAGGTFDEQVDKSLVAPGLEAVEGSGSSAGTWGIQQKSGVVVVSPAGATVAIVVPAACTADELIDTDNRAKGDVLQVYRTSDGKYLTWTLTLNSSSEFEWQPAPTYAASENGSGSITVPDASDFDLTAGSAVWLIRVDANQPVVLNGAYATGDATTVTVETGWNLIAPRLKENQTTVSLNDAVGAPANTSDTIKIPTAGAPITCEYKDGKWGYWKFTTNEAGRITGKTFVTDVTLEEGTGIWYISEGSAEVTLK